MQITEILPEKFSELFIKEGIRELYPPQSQAVKRGLLKGKNMLLCIPTAAGKTLISELAIIKALGKSKKAVYIVPLRALASEKYQDFKKYEQLGYKVRMQMGDMDARFIGDPDFDILVVTAEKCDSIMRTRQDWFSGVGILVMDEVHLIGTDRGPVYEILITKFRSMFEKENIQVLGLSATVKNAQELAQWLGAELIVSDWRPVKLTESIKVGDKDINLKAEIKKQITQGGQCLVFVNSRRSAEAGAKRIGEFIRSANLIPGNDLEKLEKLAVDISAVLDPPTQQCLKLKNCIIGGAVFHHAGLVNEQRQMIEDAFKTGLIRVISATPTLAAGVNLPAREVIIRDLMRYSGGGMSYIPVMEYRQMAGRAGRPRYDDVGYAVSLVKNQNEAEMVEEKYLCGESEVLYSRIGSKPVLSAHVLAAIASGFTGTHKSLTIFFESTFFGHQYATDPVSRENFNIIIEQTLSELSLWKFIKISGKFLIPTEIGSRVSELYIDPRTASSLIEFCAHLESLAQEIDGKFDTDFKNNLKKSYNKPGNLNDADIKNITNIDINDPGLVSLKEGQQQAGFESALDMFSLPRFKKCPAGLSIIGIFDILCNSSEMYPHLRVSRKEEQGMYERIISLEDKIYRDIDLDYKCSLDRFKTALLVEAWIEELSEKDIMENYSVAPGFLRQKIETMRWLVYSAKELCYILKLKEVFKFLRKLEIRLKYGVREELLPLVSIKGIGRARARKLFKKGYRKLSDIKNADVSELEQIIGAATARKVWKSVQ